MNAGNNNHRSTKNEKRVCLFTGAGGSLGNVFCSLYADKYYIAAIYRQTTPDVPSQAQQYVDPLNPGAVIHENNHPVYFLQADLSNERELQRIVESVLDRFGRIDLLVNAAAYSVWAPISSNRLNESMEAQFLLNTIVPIKLAAAVARSFWRNYKEDNVKLNRNIVNFSSISGVRTILGRGQSIYGASKAALNHLTRHMANEFRHFGVRVNATAPNSFPRIVSTEAAVQTIRRLDQGKMTGRILVLDKDEERLV